MASGSSRAADVQFALLRAKRKICELQQQIHETPPEETGLTSWTPSKELRDSLVDMYKDNPRVNEELRRRLPSPARQQLSNTTLQLDSSERLEVVGGSQAHQHLTEVSPLSHRKSASPVSPLSHRKSASPVSPLSHRKTASPVSPLSHRKTASPVSPLSQRRSISPVSPLLNRGSVSPLSYKRSASPVSPLLNRRRSVSPLSCQAAGAGGEMEAEFSPSRGASPRADSPEEAAAPSPAPRRHLPSAADSLNPPRHFNEDKNISLLLKELDNLRLTNNTLQEQLVMKEKELRSREVEEELREELQEVRHWERPTAVLEEVLAAQKERDQALMSRLLLANEERDEALLRVRRLQQVAETDSSYQDDREQDVDELLRCVCEADSAHEIRHVGSTLVQRLRLAWQRRNNITAQEMNAVMEERDACVAKCKRLEDFMQDSEQQPSQEQLLSLQRDRDRALEDRRRLEAELQAVRSRRSLQDLTPPPQPSLIPPPQGAPLLVDLRQLSLEKQSVEAELRRCQEAEQDAVEKVHRLERLVEVLRKKVGSGRLRAVV